MGDWVDPSLEPGIRRRETFLQRLNRRQAAAKTGDGDGGGDVNPSLNVDFGDYDPQSRRSSIVDLEKIAHLLKEDQLDADTRTHTHGVSELRDGWFDAIFLGARPLDHSSLMKHAESTLPAAFDKSSPLSIRHFFPKQRRQLESAFWRIVTTRTGFNLAKSFLAFFIAYVLCLVPEVRAWLGQYNYVMVVSTIINHPARPLGAQIDGTVWTILGTITGLGWGSLGLLLSYSTLAARLGYGGILALFFLSFIAAVAFIRSYFTRLYQFAMCAGIAMCYTLLADIDGEQINWPKLFSYGVPWVLGQAICILVNILVFVDAGSRPLAEAFHKSFGHMQDALEIPRPRNQKLRRSLARAFVDIGSAYRDLRTDVSITRFDPADVRILRNLMQGVIRHLLLLKTETCLFEKWDLPGDNQAPFTVNIIKTATSGASQSAPIEPAEEPDPPPAQYVDGLLRLVSAKLATPTQEMLIQMRSTLLRCDAVLMDMSGHRSSLGPPKDVSGDVGEARNTLHRAIEEYDKAKKYIQESGDLSYTVLGVQEVTKALLFAQYIRTAALSIETLATQVTEIQSKPRRLKLYLPSYPLKKAINNINAQVRRDRGGQAAGIYKETFGEIWALINKIKFREHQPLSRHGSFAEPGPVEPDEDTTATLEADDDLTPKSKRNKLGFRIWLILHRLQGFESKYATKVCLLTTLLAVPGWLERSRGWWNEAESWWAVVMAWMMVHPRIGGNMQDLVIRGICVVLGAAWAGFAYEARDGNPFVMAAFAIVFMLPMLYRFTQSASPRSGIGGCLSFSVISLALVTSHGERSPVFMATAHGLAFLVGTVSAVLINWMLWPFVSRHELRKAISSMFFFQSIMYRNVVAKYVYYDEARQPTAEDIQTSEMIEGKLREGFVRIRQLLIMTRHEIRLREAFDPVPYSALADACERFFEHLIAVRQAALKYDPGFVRDNDAAAEKMLPYRRDAVASILSNFYILAGALKADRKVPRYLPSAAAARKRLLDKIAVVELEVLRASRAGSSADLATTATTADFDDPADDAPKWSRIYGYAFNESLTGCVSQLEALERYTKLIVGERGFDDEYRDLMNESDEEEEEEDDYVSDGVDVAVHSRRASRRSSYAPGKTV